MKKNEVQHAFTIIGKGTVLTGDLVAEADILIEGELIGSISSKGRVVIATTGIVNGNIAAENCDVVGYIEGKLQVRQNLTLRDTAQVKGDIKTNVLTVETGAKFYGHCNMVLEDDAKGSVVKK